MRDLAVRPVDQVLLDQSLSVFLGRAKPCLTKLVTIFLIGSELRSHLLDLLVGRRGDIGISYLELHLLRFLDQHLFVDQLTQHLPGKRGLTSRVGRKLQPLRPALIYCGENITPKNCLVADDRDNCGGCDVLCGGTCTGGTCTATALFQNPSTAGE